MDWSQLEIDLDKKTFFSHLYNRYQQQKENKLLKVPVQAWTER